ncbi:MAG: chloride channel protein, partial [Nitrosopumilus sp.]
MRKKFETFFMPKNNLEHLGFGYFKKWVGIGTLIGIVAGLGSIAFFLMLQFSTQFFLGLGAGFMPPGDGELSSVYSSVAQRPWMFPLITGGGGLLVGLVISKFAPEASGHGTDAVIYAFHNKKGQIRTRIPLIKTLASAVTIGTGGSGGREGPTAQIAAGFGSLLGRLLKLNDEDRRITVATGLGAGIGSIFKAPLGGSLLSTEIFYRRDFEVKALLPALIASITGFVIFGSVFGWSPIFNISSSAIEFEHFSSLLLFAIIGLCCAGTGLLYIKTFYKIHYIFQRLQIPNFVKPAIGGVLVGIIAMFLPQVLGPGYGWLQTGVFDNPELFPLWILIAILFLKILATSLSVGSGGSAGVFGPGLVIGGFLGAIIGITFHSFGYFLEIQISTMAIVSMIAFFGAVSKAPISIIIMGSEMTGSYVLLPAMVIATVTAYILIGLKNSIYQNQFIAREESPAHRLEYQNPLLKKLLVKDALNVIYPKVTST